MNDNMQKAMQSLEHIPRVALVFTQMPKDHHIITLQLYQEILTITTSTKTFNWLWNHRSSQELQKILWMPSVMRKSLASQPSLLAQHLSFLGDSLTHLSDSLLFPNYWREQSLPPLYWKKPILFSLPCIWTSGPDKNESPPQRLGPSLLS
jgi:hypothetical protein